MPFTQQTYDNVIHKCSQIWEPSTNVVYVPDGTIYVETANGDGTFTPYLMNDTCCNAFKEYLISSNTTLPDGSSPENINFNLDEQKCKWATITVDQCSISETNNIKVVLNPVGNDGAFFTLTENDTCTLKIKFDYLFKIKCETLRNLVSANPQSKELTTLRQAKFKIDSEISDIDNEIQNLGEQNINLPYSIHCNEFPVTNITNTTTTEDFKFSQTQKLPFTNTGFGSLTNSTDLSNSTNKVAPMYETKSVTFGLTETGLSYWRNILGDINYLNFIEGEPNSYTCSDVINIEKLNQEALLNYKPQLLFETTTPFGEKTNVINKMSELNKNKSILNDKSNTINQQILQITSNINSNTCSTILGQFESITADVTLDMIDENNVTIPNIYTSTLFYPITQNVTTLYQYLVGAGDNSGFLVCGEPNSNETWASGCTGLIYPEFTNGVLGVNPLSDEINVSICNLVKQNLYDELFLESGYANTQTDLFNASLSPNIFNSNWLTFEDTIDNQNTITGITNNRIVLNIVIKTSCGDICLLVDEISLIKECSDTNRTNIFVGESPGFELTKVIDNKKSWVEATDYTERNFYISNYDDTNKIRQTEYSVDEERLVLNTKEIDLTMNMASAVENDVWCYLLEYPNLLTGSTCATLTPNDIYGNPIILPTGQTCCTGWPCMDCQDIKPQLLKYFNNECPIEYVNYFTYHDISCFPVLECYPCGSVLKFKFNYGNKEFWVTCDKQNNKTGFYLITAVTNTQSSILNITDDYISGGYIDNPNNGLNSFVDYINYRIIYENLDIPIYEKFWDNEGNCKSCCSPCGDESISITGLMTTNITEVNTLETFENLMVSELTDVKDRKILSAYPTLRAVYDRYMNATNYGVPNSNEFDYYKMDKFTGLIKTYWDDLIEQVIPATTMWGNVKVYTNTIFDQQKFKYRSYTSLFCNSHVTFATPPSPINGSEGLCNNVEVITTNISLQTVNNPQARPSQANINKVIYNSICISQMNWGSEFIGNVDIQNGDGTYMNKDTFCCRKAVWYTMVENPNFIMGLIECNLNTPLSSITFSVESFKINGDNDLITTPINSQTINSNNINWVAANNNIVYSCTTGNMTGWTYTNFVDFLNYTFYNLGLSYKYEARLSYKEISSSILPDGSTIPLEDRAKTGFYLLFPENDTFELVVTSDLTPSGPIKYTNDNIYINNIPLVSYLNQTYHGINVFVDYDCNANKLYE